MNIPKGTGDYAVNLTIGQMHAFLEDDGSQYDTAENVREQIQNHRDPLYQDFIDACGHD